MEQPVDSLVHSEILCGRAETAQQLKKLRMRLGDGFGEKLSDVLIQDRIGHVHRIGRVWSAARKPKLYV